MNERLCSAAGFTPHVVYETLNWDTVNILAANGITAYLFDELKPVPELSFAVMYRQAVAGVVITASHKPKEYNGYKVYGEDGAQMSPEATAEVVKYISPSPIIFR